MDEGPSAASGTELKARGVGQILITAFEMYRKNWAALVQVVAIVAIPLSLLGYLLTDQLIRTTAGIHTVTGANGSITDVNVSGGGFWRASLAAAVLGFVSVLIAQLLTGAITREAIGVFVGHTLSVSSAYAFALAKLWSILLVSVLVGLIVGVGFILLIVPGFIFLTFLAVSLPALVVEDKRGTSALARSRDLVRGRGWPVFGTIVVAGLLTSVVNAIITAPFGHSWFVRGLLAGIASTVTTPFTALVGVLIYLDLRVRKENLDGARLKTDLAGSGP